MKKIITTLFAIALSFGVFAQNDTMFIHTKHQHIYEFATQTIDSVIFYRTQPTMPLPCEETISQLEQQISGLKQDTATLNATIANYELQITNLKADTLAKSILIAQLEEALENCPNGDYVLQLELDITALRIDTANLKNTIAGLQSDIAKLNDTITARNNLIANLNTTISGLNTQVADLKADTTAKGILITNYELQITNLETDTANLNTTIAGLNTQVDGLKQDSANMQQLITMLATYGTWMATIPPITVATCNDASTIDLGIISFASDERWVISGNGITQIWSDAVQATGCNKTDFNGGSASPFNSDCRSNLNQKGDLFSWCAVARYGDALCPAGWRVPTATDFCDLDKAISGLTTCNIRTNATHRDIYLNTWGGAFGGGSTSDGTLNGQGSWAYYWSQSEFSADFGFILHFLSDGYINPQLALFKHFGFTLRCVR
jgi:uncharacterized protein (TIGR02145 family)